MRRLLTLVLAFAFVPVPARAYGPAELLFTFADGSITESSGCSASATDDGLLYTHNDSGDVARFFAVGPDGETRATYRVFPPLVAADWEDMARGSGRDGKPALYFADFGDNNHTRPFVTVWEVPEPATLSGDLFPSHGYNLVYPSPRRDAETFMVDPSGRLVIVTKEGNGISRVFVAEDPLDGVPTLMRTIATIDFPAILGNPEINWLATGGDISPDGSRVVVRTYDAAVEWRIPDGDLEAAFASTPSVIELTETEQGEAICYSRDGRSLITTTEGFAAPVHIYRG